VKNKKVIKKKIKKMEKESIIIIMVIDMKVIGKIIINMEKESIIIMMVERKNKFGKMGKGLTKINI